VWPAASPGWIIGRTVRRPDNLPLQLTSFIGRERMLADVTRLLSQTSPAYRLVTLTGAGGTGKSRLAMQAATALRDRFEDGVYFVPLAPITDTTLIATAIAQAVGVSDAMGLPSATTLSAYFRDQHVLLVLDNFEQLLSGAVQTTELLAACPRLTLLVTSRAPLRVSGEREMAVPPLAVPELPAQDRLDAQRLEALSESESVSLFIDRAQAVKADFSLTPENTRAIVEICRRVDGLPLAIELATARMRFLDPWAVLERLQHRLQFLTGGARDLPTRQHTLRNTIAWSYDLLDRSGQALFRRISIFVGGCSLDAAQAVCGDGEDVLDGIDSLVASSLLQSVAAQGGVRISMLETIREFGLEQLALAGELETLRWRHADYFLQLAERAEPELWNPTAGRWIHRLDLDHDNFRATLEWCLESGSQTHAQTALRMAGALCQFWWTRSYFDEGRRWLARVLAAVPEPSAWRMKALHGAGWLAHFQRDSNSARELLAESLAIARTADDQRAVAWVLHALGRVAYFENDPATARTLGQQSLEIAEALGDRWLIAWAHHLLGLAAHIIADYPAAQAAYERSLAIRREVGHQMGAGILIQLMGMLAHSQRDFASARALYLESLETFRDMNSHWQLSQMLALFASLAAVQQQPERAARLVGATETAKEWSRTQPVPLTEQLFREGCGLARQALGEARFTTAVGDGRAMSLDEALAEARAVDVKSPADARAIQASRYPDDLTPTEVKVLQLLTAGRSTKQIAEELAVAVSTVDRHITHIYDKTGARGRAAAAAFALRHGLA
jgi:predicted ATPase/DNA-binding CsgD family transcriptional regulator